MSMDDHLRDLGREMVLELSPPHHLWRPQDLEYLESMGFRNILTKINVRCFHSIFDESMNSRVTFFLGQSDICVVTSASLLWLELQGYCAAEPMKSIPSWVPLQSLQCLRIKRERFETLWKNRIQEFCSSQSKTRSETVWWNSLDYCFLSLRALYKFIFEFQVPSQLKELHISQASLKKVPISLGVSDNLEKVSLDAGGLPIQGMSLLESLNMNLCNSYLRISTLEGKRVSTERGERITCESLVIYNFKFSGEVAWNNGAMPTSVRAPMSGLEKLEISDQDLVSKILISGIHYSSFESIKLHHMKDLMEVDLIRVKTLNCLVITNCERLKSISGISNLAKLVLLNINKWLELEELTLGHLSYPERIAIVGCKHLRSVSIISNLAKVVLLNIGQCPKLKKKTLGQLSCLERVTNVYCNHLKGLLGISNLAKLELLNISQCPELEGLTLDHLSCLEKITIQNCNHLKCVSGISNLAKLVELGFFCCAKLESECFYLSGMKCLESITFDTFVKVKYFMLDGCKILKTIKFCCEELVELSIRGCPEFEELPDFRVSSCVERIIIDGCERFKDLQLHACPNLRSLSGNMEVRGLYISESPELEDLSCLSKMNCLEKIGIDY